MSYRKKVVVVFVAMLLIFSFNENASAHWFGSLVKSGAKAAVTSGRLYVREKVKKVFTPNKDKSNSTDKKKK